MARDIFISYSTKDTAVTTAAVAALEASGYTCWMAPRDIRPGIEWSEAIIDGIAECRLFLLILSSASDDSPQVRREVQNAVGERKTVMPFCIENFPLSKTMRYFLGTPHWLTAYTSTVESHFPRLVAAVQTWLSVPQEEALASAFLPQEVPPVVTVLPPVEVPVAPTNSACSKEQLSQVEAALCSQIGPMAPLLVRRAAAVSRGYTDLCRRLAEEIPNQREQRIFVEKCKLFAPVAPPEPISTAPTPKTSVSAAVTTVEPSNVSQPLSPEVIAAAEHVLASYIGPLAHMLAARTARGATDRADFHERLIAHLPTPALKNEFLRKLQSTP